MYIYIGYIGPPTPARARLSLRIYYYCYVDKSFFCSCDLETITSIFHFIDTRSIKLVGSD